MAKEKVLLMNIPSYMKEMYGLWLKEKFDLKAEFCYCWNLKEKLSKDSYKTIIIDSNINKKEKTIEIIRQIREFPAYSNIEILISSADDFNLPKVTSYYSLDNNTLEKILS